MSFRHCFMAVFVFGLFSTKTALFAQDSSSTKSTEFTRLYLEQFSYSGSVVAIHDLFTPNQYFFIVLGANTYAMYRLHNKIHIGPYVGWQRSLSTHGESRVAHIAGLRTSYHFLDKPKFKPYVSANIETGQYATRHLVNFFEVDTNQDMITSFNSRNFLYFSAGGKLYLNSKSGGLLAIYWSPEVLIQVPIGYTNTPFDPFSAFDLAICRFTFEFKK